MTNIEKYNQTFVSSFSVKEEKLLTLSYQSVDGWDSIGHMRMIAELEEIFDIMIETNDILDFSSYVKGFEILKKYGVAL
ncbi:MAG TPA: acyl carrier protein [Bacteroidia bacterium]|jgi:acyl carrier protein|nr:acyl carrier protein [Bacteroidia bacterium]